MQTQNMVHRMLVNNFKPSQMIYLTISSVDHLLHKLLIIPDYSESLLL